jgi:ribosomal protein S18 acetylase RimI-like enzyme
MKKIKPHKIREIKKEDAKQIFDLLNNLEEDVKKVYHPHSFDYKTVKDICKNQKDHYFVMEKNNQIIGYSFLRLFGYENPSFGIVIRKEYTDKGYGTILTKWTINKARKLGYDKVILKTYKENLPAQRIYKKLGFKIIGESKDKKEYRMELNL